MTTIMKIILCGSISKCEEITSVAERLTTMGHTVEIPFGCKHLRGRTEVTEAEKAHDKAQNNLIKRYYDLIATNDAVIIVNPEKNGIAGCVGGNSFLEMGFAHVLGKALYCLYAPGEISYLSEILAMQPTILDGDLTSFPSSRT